MKKRISRDELKSKGKLRNLRESERSERSERE